MTLDLFMTKTLAGSNRPLSPASAYSGGGVTGGASPPLPPPFPSAPRAGSTTMGGRGVHNGNGCAIGVTEGHFWSPTFFGNPRRPPQPGGGTRHAKISMSDQPEQWSHRNRSIGERGEGSTILHSSPSGVAADALSMHGGDGLLGVGPVLGIALCPPHKETIGWCGLHNWSQTV